MDLIAENWQVLPEHNSGNENAIIFTISDDYAFAVANMLMGLNKYSTETMKNTDVIVYHNGISDQNAQRLRSLHANTYFISMQFPAQWMQIADHPKTMRWGYFIVCKFFGYELVKRYKTAIFMDADMLIRGDISELFELDADIAWRRILAWDVNEVFADLIEPGTQILCGNGGLLVFTDRLRKYNIGVDDVTAAFDKIKDFAEGGIDETVIAWLAYEKGMTVKELEVEIYNTSAVYLRPETKIVHFLDARGVITKPWMSLAAYLYYEDWVENHQKWLEMSGDEPIQFTKDDYFQLFGYDRVTENRKLKKQKKKLKAEISDLTGNIEQLNRSYADLIKQKDKVDLKNEKLKIRIEEQTLANNALEEKNASLSKQISALNEQINVALQKNADLLQNYNDLQKLSDKKSEKIDKLSAENDRRAVKLKERAEKIKSLKEESKQKSDRISRLEKQLDTMRNSKSWRLTKPLRMLTKFLKKLFNRK